MGEIRRFEDEFGGLLRRSQLAARRIVGRSELAEEIAAETMARAWQHWAAIEAEAAPWWVVRVATNLAIDSLRRRHPVPSGRTMADDPADDVVLRDAVAAALADLPEQQRQATLLRHFGGLSHDEVASAMGVARSTAAVHLSRAGAALRARLDQPDQHRGEPMKITSFEEAIAAMEARTVLTGVVTAITKGGLAVDVGLDAFMPARSVDLRKVDDLTSFLGRDVDCVVTGVHPDKAMVAVSRERAIVGGEELARRRRWFESLEVGDHLTGTVESIVPFGAFVELEGGYGLVHSSWLDEVELIVGDPVSVQLLAVDVERERASLRLVAVGREARAARPAT